MLGEKEKQQQEVSAPANDTNKPFDWLIFFLNCDWTRAWRAVMSNALSQRPTDQNCIQVSVPVQVHKYQA